MKSSLFSILLPAALAVAVFAAPVPLVERTVFSARELAQGYREQFVLAQPLPHHRATVETDEAREGTRVQERFPRFRDLRIIEVAANEDAAQAVERLRATGRYAFVERDLIRHVEFEPSDPQFANGNQWALHNNGAANGIVGADIQATSAWDLIREAPGVVVAVIDTGVNINHQDLAGNIWQNPAPTFGDVNGAQFLNGTVSGNPADDNGHGTHVAGTIGAVGDNSLGITGVASRVQIMPIKAFNANGLGSDTDIVRAINYAISHHADIINASFGENGGTGSVVSNAQRVALEGARAAGVIVVAAAGNSTLNIDLSPSYPASYELDNIVTTAASTRRDELAIFSNYGAGVDLFAPGAEIVSLSHATNTGTATKSGTSMAAPHVAGALALLKARFPGDNYRQLINRLLRGVERGPSFLGKAQTNGRLNLFNALNTDSNQPFNDRFADRPRLVGDNARVRSSNAGATTEQGEPVATAIGPSLWWEWSPSSNGVVTIDTAGSGQDTVLAVFTSNQGVPPAGFNDLSVVAFNDDAGESILTSRVTFASQAGALYQIAVSSKSASGGPALLSINTSPANDFFSGAVTLTGESARATGFNANCSLEAGETKAFSSYGGNSLWYRWTAPRHGRFQISVYSPHFDPVMAVFTGTAVNALTRITENDNAGFSTIHPGSLCTIDATAGTTYAIVVDSKNIKVTGQFTITVVDSLWQGATGDSVTGSAAVADDGTVYVGSTDNSLYAYSPSGALKWSKATGGFLDSSSPAIARDGSVVVGSNDGKVYAFFDNGTSKWTRDLGSSAPVSNSPSIAADGTVYIKAGDGFLYALEPATGAIRWRRDINGPATYAGASIAPDGTIYQGSDDGTLYALRPDGTIKWTFSAGHDIYTAPALDAVGNIYFGLLTSGELICLSAEGTLRWRYTGAALGSSSSPALSPDGRTAYFGGYDRKLHAVNTANGAARWTYLLGDEVRASSPAVDANGVIYIGCYDAKLYAIRADGTLKRTYDTGAWIRSGPAIFGTTLYIGSNDAKLYAFDIGATADTGPWPQYRQNTRRLGRAFAAPSVTTQPASQAGDAHGSVTFTAAATGDSTSRFQWQHNGTNLPGATSPALTLSDLQPAQAGLYSAVITNGAQISTQPAVLGVLTTAKALGSASELRADIVHANGLVYDQVLLSGATAGMTADAGQIVRLSFIDLTNDIVQVEFGGAGTLSIALDNPSDPAAPQNYVQPGVNYMKGHASIVIAGADETTNVSVFSVGRITAVDQSLFRNDITYDGVADIAYIAILSRDGRFGGIRTGNTSFVNTRSLTGIYAPGVQFTGPVIVGDISAADSATPVLVLGSAEKTSVNGGDLFQLNGRPVRVSGLTALQFVAGTNSHGTPQPAQANRAHLEQNGVEVTSQVVVNPKP